MNILLLLGIIFGLINLIISIFEKNVARLKLSVICGWVAATFFFIGIMYR